jgi:nucleolar protein 12
VAEGPEQANGHVEDQEEGHHDAPTNGGRKRRRTDVDDHLEEEAMKRIAGTSDSSSSDSADESTSDDSTSEPAAESEDVPVPKHETLTNPIAPSDLDKAARTVFLGNVCTTAITSKVARKTLERHLTSFTLPPTGASSAGTPPPEEAPHLESLRFRSTAYTTALPKRASFARRDLHAATTPSTHAYAVYSSRRAAAAAARELNASSVLGRRLRVDCVAHPLAQAPRRCVFVGNLDFVDDDRSVREEEALRRAKGGKGGKVRERPPADVEEGLWREFAKAGKVESVRVVRDGKTRVGKGFAYVQFTVRLCHFGATMLRCPGRKRSRGRAAVRREEVPAHAAPPPARHACKGHQEARREAEGKRQGGRGGQVDAGARVQAVGSRGRGAGSQGREADARCRGAAAEGRGGRLRGASCQGQRSRGWAQGGPQEAQREAEHAQHETRRRLAQDAGSQVVA